MTDRTKDDSIQRAALALGGAELTENACRDHLWPLFSGVVARREETNEIYLANHSLGRPLDRTADDVRHALDHWYHDLDGAWGPWTEAINKYRALVADLIGCERRDAVVHKTSAGQGLRTVLNTLEPKGDRLRVCATRGEFDACDFILKAYAQKGRIDIDWIESDDRARFDAGAIAAGLRPEHDLLVTSHVFFSTGQLLDGLAGLITRAHELGVYTLVDAYHSAGVRPVGFDSLRTDFMIGGNYKYTRGGSGACWLAVRSDHLDNPDLRPIDTGWFAKADHFGYSRSDEAHYAEGGDGWQEGTPGLLCMVQALAGLEFTLAVGADRLRAYNVEQRAFLADVLRDAGAEVVDDEPRGAFLLVPADDPDAACASLRHHGVVVDGRRDPLGRGFVRLCPDVLTTRAEMERCAPIVNRGIAAPV
ncbi:MAG: aminotransferase class V-fold PLP-dependent enzyme [Planctomycetota bacterium]